MREFVFPEDRFGCHFIGALAGVAGGLTGGGGGGGGGGIVSGVAGALSKAPETSSATADIANRNQVTFNQQGNNRNNLAREGPIENGGFGGAFSVPRLSFLPGVAPPIRGSSGFLGGGVNTFLIPLLLAAAVGAFFIFRRN